MYSTEIKRILKKKKIKYGDKIKIKKSGLELEGIILPKSAGDSNIILIKLSSGYNTGIKINTENEIEKVESGKIKSLRPKVGSLKVDKQKPTISILGCGGTVASKVDYETGAVSPTFDPKDLVEMYPEIGEITNIRFRSMFNTLSENMTFDHYKKIIKEIMKEIKKGVDGIIITHGTDTMHYTSAALALALQNLPVAVILVGSQRSSDRGSSDAFLNLLGAVRFITETDFSGVAIAMHESMDDRAVLILPPCRTRKMHSSRRDAFKPIDAKAIARVDEEIKFFTEYQKKDKNRKLIVKDKFEKKVGLLKIHPNMDPKILDVYKSYRGLVLEGFGLGHAPVEDGNEAFFRKLKTLAKKTIVLMTTQTIFGEVNMNVYATGRKLQEIGVIPVSMLPEVAFIKLAWLLGNHPPSKVRELVTKDLCGEFRSWDTFRFLQTDKD